MILVCLFMSGCATTMRNISDTSAPDDSSNSAQTLAQAVNPVDTPEECFNWIYTNIQYSAEAAAEGFSAPEITYQRKTGDCTDFAVMADYIMKQHGYKTQVITVFNQTSGHSICVWQDADGKYNYIANTGIKYLKVSNLAEVASNVYTDWQVYVLYPSNESVARQV
jgi:hypothetical protein